MENGIWWGLTGLLGGWCLIYTATTLLLLNENAKLRNRLRGLA